MGTYMGIGRQRGVWEMSRYIKRRGMCRRAVRVRDRHGPGAWRGEPGQLVLEKWKGDTANGERNTAPLPSPWRWLLFSCWCCLLAACIWAIHAQSPGPEGPS